MPCWRHSSATGTPASPSLSTATIWLSVNLLFFKGVSRQGVSEILLTNVYPKGELTRALRGGGGGGHQSVELTLARVPPTLCERACTRWWPSVAWLTQVQAMQLRACGDLHASGRLEQFADVRLPVFLLRQDVFFLHLALGDAPKLAHFMRGRVRDDEGLEHNIRLPQPLLDVLD